MKTSISFPLKRLLAAGVIVAFSMANGYAGLQIPYAVDASTLHLWHFDGASTNLDGTTNILVPDEVLTSAITLTNIGQPTPGLPPYTNTSLGIPSFTGLTNSMRTTDRFAMAYGGLFPDVSPLCDTNTGAFTFEALVRFNVNPLAAPNQLEIVAGDQPGGIAQRGWQFRVNTSGRLEFNLLGGNGGDNQFTPALPSTGPNAAVQGQWYHTAVTFTGSNPTNGDTPNQLKLYWTLMDVFRTNADLLGTFTMTRNLSGTTNPAAGTVQPALGIGGSGRRIIPGGNGVANGEGLIGNVDEVRISSVARQSNQMAFVTGGALTGPSFLSQPPTSAFIGYGKDLNVPAIPVGTLPVFNQWQRTNSSAGGFTNVPGQAQNNLIINDLTFSAGGAYRLIATNAFGSATSVVVQVTVGAAFSELFNTGVSQAGVFDTNAVPPTSPDLHYQLIQSSDFNLLGPNAAVWNMFGFPIAAFNGNFANASDTSAWIGPTNNTYVSPAGQYVFRTKFVLDSVDLSLPAHLSGIWYENETGVDILINGQPTGNSFPAAASSNGKFSAPFSITNGFVAGVNTLDFVLLRPNPPFNGTYQEAALRVDMSDSVIQLSAVGTALPPAKPTILNHPANQTVRNSNPFGASTASFSVVARGRPPLSYEWRAEGTAISGATNRTFFIATPSTNGPGTNFTVVVSNDSGSVTSQVAVLTIVETNQPPITPSYNLVVYSNTVLNVNLSTLLHNASDPDNEPINLGGLPFDPTSTNGVAIGLVGVNATYQPLPDYVGADMFNYYISDLFGPVPGAIYINVVPLAVPTVTSTTVSGNNVVLAGTGGAAGGGYHVLSSTDLTVPLINWTPIAEGTFDGSGNFNYTAAILPGVPMRFYIIQVP